MASFASPSLRPDVCDVCVCVDDVIRRHVMVYLRPGGSRRERVPVRRGAYKNTLLGRPPETLCLHFPRRHHRCYLADLAQCFALDLVMRLSACGVFAAMPMLMMLVLMTRVLPQMPATCPPGIDDGMRTVSWTLSGD